MTEETLEKIKEDYEIMENLLREHDFESKNAFKSKKVSYLSALGYAPSYYKGDKKVIINRIFNQYKDEIDEDNSVNVYVYMGVNYVDHDLNEMRLIFNNLETLESVSLTPSELEEFSEYATVIYPKEILSEDIEKSAEGFHNVRAEFLQKAVKEGQNSAKRYVYEKYGQNDIEIF